MSPAGLRISRESTEMPISTSVAWNTARDGEIPSSSSHTTTAIGMKWNQPSRRISRGRSRSSGGTMGSANLAASKWAIVATEKK